MSINLATRTNGTDGLQLDGSGSVGGNLSRAVTLEMVGGLGARSWSRRESLRVASEWLLMSTVQDGDTMVVGSPPNFPPDVDGPGLIAQLDLIMFFRNEGGRALLCDANVQNRLEIEQLGIDVICPARPRNLRIVHNATCLRYQVPVTLGSRIIIPGQQIDLSEVASIESASSTVDSALRDIG